MVADLSRNEVDDYAYEEHQNSRISALYTNLHRRSALGTGFTFVKFMRVLGEYLKPSRYFHGLDHVLDMAERDESLPEMASIYSMVASLYHDTDYPSIKEDMSEESAKHVYKYVEEREDGQQYLKPLDPDDRVGKMLYATFGFSAGQLLTAAPTANSPGGMNEFYSAARAAGDLKDLGKDDTFILGVVASIEATYAFSRDPQRMNKLKARVSAIAAELGIDLEKPGKTPPFNKLDEIMIGAVATANRDVIGFLGGLDPEHTQEPTPDSVRYTIRGGDLLSAEEVRAMRTRGKPHPAPGDYTPKQFLEAKIKRAGLYHFVIPGSDDSQSIDNLFHSVDLSTGKTYPLNGWTEKANKLGYANNRPVRVAEYARMASAGVIAAIVESCGDRIDSTTITLKDLVDGTINRVNPGLTPGADRVKQLAYCCLNGRYESDGSDISRSPLAELILNRLTVEQIEAFGKAARPFLAPLKPGGPVLPDPQGFLKLATEHMGSIVAEIRDQMVMSTNHLQLRTASAALSSLSLPRVPGRSAA